MNLFSYTVVISGRKEIKMQDISNLIKEARPLYHKRKKQRRVVKSALLGMVCLFVVFVNIPNYKINDDFYNPYLDLGYEENQGTYVENLGLPVDDYGLLLVS